ncbi:alpha/beta hydrolase, partial [Kineococcus indalonis]|uniref:alpha/beta hydrolase n=1 Tax=Kineococcus indalonis TaxID=2696566 RepID=UPI00196AD359
GTAAPGTAAPGTAVLAWAAHPAPPGLGPGAATDAAARAAAGPLRATLEALHRSPEHRATVLLCHSYGSTVCAAALADGAARGVRHVVDLASPGVGSGDLPAGVRRWVATGEGDPVRWVPHVHVLGLGLGVDAAAAPGARRLPVDGVHGHSDYLARGSATLAAVAALVTAP